MQRKWLLFSGAVVLQLLLLAAVFVPRLNVLANGKTVILETLPYDPYSIFSGYYVDLRYRISEPGNLPGQKTYQERQDYYVTLEPDEQGIWQPVMVSKKLPLHLTTAQAVIHGRYRYGRFDYGIGQYYLPEARRKRMEAIFRDTTQTVLVEIKVNQKGDAALVKLRVGKERFEY